MALRLVGPVRNPEKKLAMSIGSGELIQLVWEKQACHAPGQPVFGCKYNRPLPDTSHPKEVTL